MLQFQIFSPKPNPVFGLNLQLNGKVYHKNLFEHLPLKTDTDQLLLALEQSHSSVNLACLLFQNRREKFPIYRPMYASIVNILVQRQNNCYLLLCPPLASGHIIKIYPSSTTGGRDQHSQLQQVQIFMVHNLLQERIFFFFFAQL